MPRRVVETLYGIYAVLILGVLPWIVLAPVMMILPTLHLRRAMGRAGVRLGLWLAAIPFEVRGLQHLPPGNCVLVSNHASYFDGPLLTAALPARFTFVVQHGAASWPWFGWVLRRMGVTFINREQSRQGARQTRALIRGIAGGQSLVVFAEGGFEARPALRPFRKGAFLMAVHAGVPVVPAVIRGTRQLFGHGQRLPRWSRVAIEIFPAVSAEPAAEDSRQSVLEMRDRTRAIVLRHCGEPDGAAT